MKKLLSLLSVLTISSSAIPKTIAARPYQKENNNNNLRETMKSDSNNLETSNRNKREDEITYISELLDINLEVAVPTVAQTESLSCGPVIAESILRSLGLRNFRTPDTPLYSCQQHLIGNMETTLQIVDNFNFLGGGTIVPNWTNTVNNYIINNRLNNFRRYIAHSLNPSINDPTLAGSTRVGVDYNNYR